MGASIRAGVVRDSWQVLRGRKGSWPHDKPERCLGQHGQCIQDASRGAQVLAVGQASCCLPEPQSSSQGAFRTLLSAKEDVKDSIIFVHPTVGPTQPGDIDGKARIKTYEVMQEEPFYKKWAGDAFRWAYLPYSMKMAGPREAIQHMIIRKNFGATHFIIGRDMAGTKSTLDSEGFYGAFEAQEMGKKHSKELEVTVVDYPNMVYVGEEHGNERGYISDKAAKEKGLKINKLSGTEFRKRLRSGDEIPEWFAFPSVVKTLREGGDGIFL